MHQIKRSLSVFALAFGLCALLFSFSSPAADWNASYGMGNTEDSWAFTGTGVPFTAVASVHSNAVYYATSARSTGIPSLSAWFQSDLVAGTLKWYQATASYQITTNADAGANVFALNSTNGLAGGDVLLFRKEVGGYDSYQMLVNSNNLAYGVCTYNALTNAAVAGDRIYKMTAVSSFTPMQMHAVTNQVPRPGVDLTPLSVSSQFIEFNGRIGWPCMLVQTYSNAGGLFVTGEYLQRQRR